MKYLQYLIKLTLICIIVQSCSFEISDNPPAIYKADILGGWETDADFNDYMWCEGDKTMFFTEDEVRIRRFNGENCTFYNDYYYTYTIEDDVLIINGYGTKTIQELTPLVLRLGSGVYGEERFIR